MPSPESRPVLQDTGHGDAAAFLYAHQTVGAEFSVLGSVAQPLWIVVAVAAGISLRRNGARAMSWQAMFVSVLFAAHGGPIAAVGLLGLTVAIWSQQSHGLELGVGERPHEPSPSPAHV